MDHGSSSPVSVARSRSRTSHSKNQDSQPEFDFDANRDRARANPSRWASHRQVTPPSFDGSTYNAEHDEIRLSGQMAAVFTCMSDGRWRTLAEIRAEIKRGSEAGISARLRDCRKQKHGGSIVNRRRRGNSGDGLFEYQLIVNPATVVKAITSEARS